MEQLDKGKVSIVVPVYKAEKTIKRCVDSILAQTYTDFELILVDDGTPDNSGKICDEYAQLDSRVKVFHKENGGVSSARNLGIDNAQGKYLVFVDSDDYVGEDYLLHMLQVDAQFVIGGFHKDIDGVHEYWVPQGKRLHVASDLKEAWTRFNNLYIYILPTAKLYLLEIIKKHHIQFDESIFYSEDFCFVMDYMARVEYFDLLEKTDYNYIIPKEELNRSKKYKMNAKQTIIHYEAVEFRMKILDKISGVELEDMRNNVYSRLLNNFLSNLYGLNKLSDRYVELRKLAKGLWKGVFFKYATLYNIKRKIALKVLMCILAF